MYGRGGILGAITAITVTAGAYVFPNIGGNFVITLAIGVSAGMAVWGGLYFRNSN